MQVANCSMQKARLAVSSSLSECQQMQSHSLTASPEGCKYKAGVGMISMEADSLASLHLLLLQGAILKDGK